MFIANGLEFRRLFGVKLLILKTISLSLIINTYYHKFDRICRLIRSSSFYYVPNSFCRHLFYKYYNWELYLWFIKNKLGKFLLLQVLSLHFIFLSLSDLIFKPISKIHLQLFNYSFQTIIFKEAAIYIV